ncbi:MAG TPA: C40 family peptidase [Longimicrobium sp.]
MRSAVDETTALVEAVREEFAPDPRTAVFEVSVEVDGDAVALVGVTSEANAADELRLRIAGLTGWREVRDEVQRLPDTGPEEMVHALVTSAVAPMLSGPAVRETQISQTVLGNRLVVLRSVGRWLQCRAYDGYIGWIHAGYLALQHEHEARAWEVGGAGEPWISLGAEVIGHDGERIIFLPWGARVMREPDGLVRLPDGRVGTPHGDLFPAALRPMSFPTVGEAMCETGSRWLGAPYLWGGVTMGGVDCSGFVQALHRLHGTTIPRDSDQQSRSGAEVDPGEDFSRLKAGDLLFFAEDSGGRVTHVTMSTGGSRIIHSSLGNGGVARNDMMGRRNYERELRRIFVCARRMI